MTADEYAFKVAGSTDIEWLRGEIRWWRERCRHTNEFYKLAVDQWVTSMRALVAARDKDSGSSPMFELDQEINALRLRLQQLDDFTREHA